MRAIVWILGWVFLSVYIKASGGVEIPEESLKPVFGVGFIWAIGLDLWKK